MKFIHLQKSNTLINLAHVPTMDIVYEDGEILIRVVDAFKATICRDYPIEKVVDAAQAKLRIEHYETEISTFLNQTNSSGVLSFDQSSIRVL